MYSNITDETQELRLIGKLAHCLHLEMRCRVMQGLTVENLTHISFDVRRHVHCTSCAFLPESARTAADGRWKERRGEALGISYSYIHRVGKSKKGPVTHTVRYFTNT